MNYLTISEVSEKLTVHENTVRRYAKTFSEFLPSKRFGKAVKYTEEGIPILAKVAEWYQSGKSTEEIRLLLAAEHEQIIEIELEQDHDTTTITPTTPPDNWIAQQQQLTNLVALQSEQLREIGGTLRHFVDIHVTVTNQQKEIDQLKQQIIELQSKKWWQFWK